MDNNLSTDINTLRALYEKECNELHAKLLDGVAWNDLRDQRKKVTKLAVTLHKKISRVITANPAEFPSNNIEERRPKQKID